MMVVEGQHKGRPRPSMVEGDFLRAWGRVEPGSHPGRFPIPAGEDAQVIRIIGTSSTPDRGIERRRG